MAIKASILIILCVATAASAIYVVPLEAGFTDGLSNIFLGKSQLFDWQVGTWHPSKLLLYAHA